MERKERERMGAEWWERETTGRVLTDSVIGIVSDSVHTGMDHLRGETRHFIAGHLFTRLTQTHSGTSAMERVCFAEKT